ncbi:Replication protein A DNA-binding subunit E [Glycine soja]
MTCYNPKELQQQCELKVVIPCVVLSLILWAFCVYLEAVSVLPQLRVMQNTKIVEPFIAHYIFALGVARFLSCAQWVLQVFSFDVVDFDGGEIWATCFNVVADQFYNVIEAGKLKRILITFRNDQELTLDVASIIQPFLDDNDSITSQTFNYRPISEIESLENNNIVDVIGVNINHEKNGTEVQKRTLQLKDMSGRSVELTLWGNFCIVEGQRLQTICHVGEFLVLATKVVILNDFNGKSVGTITTSQLYVEADFPEACTLKRWFENEGKSVPTLSISREMSNLGKTDVWKTISQIKDEKLGTLEKPDWIFVFVVVSHIKIGDRQCNKKVTNNADGTWHCERCNQFIDACDFRYLLSMQIQDHTSITWNWIGVPRVKNLKSWFFALPNQLKTSTYLFKLSKLD